MHSKNLENTPPLMTIFVKISYLQMWFLGSRNAINT